MLCTLLAPALLALTTPLAAPQEGRVDVAREIRASVRWLRSTQDLSSGGYEGDLEATALAVIAFAECPDHYRAIDGPFVRLALTYLTGHQAADGSISTADAPDATRERSTALAVTALRLGDGGHAEPLARARAWLGDHGGVQAPGEFPYGLELGELPDDPEGASSLAAALLAERDDGGFWVGPRGRTVETAVRIVLLSHLASLEGGAPSTTASPEDLPEFSPTDRAAALAAIARGADFLAQLADEQGRFGAPGHPDAGITAMALSALQAVPAPRPAPLQERIDAGLAWLVSLQREDGSIHDGKLANYITSASILALVRAEREDLAPLIARASAFLQRLQVDEEEGYSEGDLYYGGIGYGSTERPDLSNLQMALEALSSAGVEGDSPTYSKALSFLQRVQNRSESSDLHIVDDGSVIRSGDDGGAGYLPGDSKAGFVELADGTRVPRSYGSMTYALLKCYVFAGLPKEDPRLQAAFDWCRANYTLDVNPGFQHARDPSAAYQGLYYYFLTMARALDAYGAEQLETPDGERHAWRAELCGRLVSMQSRIDGSWINRNSPRWYEGNPLLATAYALLTLESALPPGPGGGEQR